jgi:DNA-binding transcriptional LysR family regulator
MMRAPSLRAMELFASLMRTRSLTATARRMGVSQPAASLALKELEGQTGLTLFARTPGRLVPTAEAEALLPVVDRLLGQAGAVLRRIEALRSGEGAGTLRVGCIPSLGGTLLPAVLAGFQRSRPDVAIRIEVQPYAGVLDLVREEAVEVGFVNQPDEPDGLAEGSPLLTTWLACLMAPDHPLAGPGPIGLERLRGHTTILAAHGDLPAAELRRRLGLDGARAAKGIEVNNVYAAMAMARERLGVALLNPLMLLTAQAHGLVGQALESDIALPMVALTPGHGPAVEALLEEAHIAARDAAGRLDALGLAARAA